MHVHAAVLCHYAYFQGICWRKGDDGLIAYHPILAAFFLILCFCTGSSIPNSILLSIDQDHIVDRWSCLPASEHSQYDSQTYTESLFARPCSSFRLLYIALFSTGMLLFSGGFWDVSPPARLNRLFFVSEQSESRPFSFLRDRSFSFGIPQPLFSDVARGRGLVGHSRTCARTR